MAQEFCCILLHVFILLRTWYGTWYSQYIVTLRQEFAPRSDLFRIIMLFRYFNVLPRITWYVCGYGSYISGLTYIKKDSLYGMLRSSK